MDCRSDPATALTIQANANHLTCMMQVILAFTCDMQAMLRSSHEEDV